jgi:anti-sigma factor RsiW
MTCLINNKQGTETLLDYCAGTLGPERAKALENHAVECGACREWIAAQKSLWNALDQMEAPEISADFDARLYARIAQENAQPMWRAWWNRISLSGFAWKRVLAGGVAAAVLAVGLMMNAPMIHTHNAPAASRQIRPEAVDVEQLEVTLQDLEMLTPPSASNGKSPTGKM